MSKKVIKGIYYRAHYERNGVNVSTCWLLATNSRQWSPLVVLVVAPINDVAKAARSIRSTPGWPCHGLPRAGLASPGKNQNNYFRVASQHSARGSVTRRRAVRSVSRAHHAAIAARCSAANVYLFRVIRPYDAIQGRASRWFYWRKARFRLAQAPPPRNAFAPRWRVLPTNFSRFYENPNYFWNTVTPF